MFSTSASVSLSSSKITFDLRYCSICVNNVIDSSVEINSVVFGGVYEKEGSLFINP